MSRRDNVSPEVQPGFRRTTLVQPQLCSTVSKFLTFLTRLEQIRIWLRDTHWVHCMFTDGLEFVRTCRVNGKDSDQSASPPVNTLWHPTICMREYSRAPTVQISVRKWISKTNIKGASQKLPLEAVVPICLSAPKTYSKTASISHSCSLCELNTFARRSCPEVAK